MAALMIAQATATLAERLTAGLALFVVRHGGFLCFKPHRECGGVAESLFGFDGKSATARSPAAWPSRVTVGRRYLNHISKWCWPPPTLR